MIKFFSKMTVVKTMFLLAVFFSTAVSAQDSALINLEYGLNELVYDVAGSIVTIEASGPIYPDNYAENNNEAVYSVISTGLIFDSSGFILAPAESVSKFSSIFVRFDDRTIPAKTVAIDYQNGIALLQMPQQHGVPVKLKSQMGCAGQMILAVGNAYGVRAAPALGICAGYRPDGMMQFSASFTPSSHGGGLFSMDGKLLGIITAQIGKNSEIGLAIPAYKLPEIVEYLNKNGDRQAGYLGLVTREIEISPPIKIQMNNSTNQFSATATQSTILVSHGLLIEKVAPHSPAYKGGLRVGDLLFQANGFSIDSPTEFANYIRKTSPGTKIKFDFLRHNVSYNIELVVGTQIQDKNRSDVPYGSKSDMLVDSIVKEIQMLKENINMLEKRLKEVR